MAALGAATHDFTHDKSFTQAKPGIPKSFD
jgi:hypothetical protein